MINVSDEQMKIITDIIKKHVSNCKVRAFGSRYKRTNKEYSDLDIAVVGEKKQELKALTDLREAFEESDLPFRVDVLDWHEISPEFRNVIEEGYEVIYTPRVEDSNSSIVEGIKRDWKEVRLGDVIQFNPTETIKKNSMAKKVAMDKLLPFNKTITGFEYTEFTGGTKFRNGDTLLARITPCLENGKTAQVNIFDEDEVGFGSTEFIVLREKPNSTYNDFIFYLAISQDFRSKAIQSMTGTTGRQRVQTDLLQNTMMPVPSLKEQRAIAAVLSALDDKIEVNNQINKRLEEIALTIFKSWFVDFEPFQDGEFEDSELGRIPKGWRTGSIVDLGDVVGGSTPSKAIEDYYTDNGIPWITPKDLSLNYDKFISRGEIDVTEKGLKNSSIRIMPRGTVLFSSRAPIGYIAIAKNDVTTNQGFKSIVPKEKIGTEYTYFYLRSNLEIIESRASGSTFKEVSGSVMKQIPALIPSDEALSEFRVFCNCYFKHQEALEEQNNTLAAIRNALLPRLMSGEIRIPMSSQDDIYI